MIVKERGPQRFESDAVMPRGIVPIRAANEMKANV
jgi:hypothetical protein